MVLGLVFYFLVTGGEVLRYACDCQKIFREEGEEGARRFREGLGTTITEEERALFLRCLGAEEENATWRPGGSTCNTGNKTSRSPARLALTLLESLLAVAPGDRPANGGVIERRLNAIRQVLKKPQRISREASASRSFLWKWWITVPVVVGVAIGVASNGTLVQMIATQIVASTSSPKTDPPESQLPLPAARPLIYSAKDSASDPLLPTLILPSASP